MSCWRAYQILLFTMPLAFGANTDWAWSLYAAIVFALLGMELRALITQQQLQQLPSLPAPKAFIKAKPIVYLLLASQLIVALQWVLGLSDAPHDSYLQLILGLSFTAFFALSLLILNNRQRIQRIIWVIVLAAAFQAIYGALMVLSGLEWSFFTTKNTYIGKATGTFINRNHLAGYLEMTLAIGIGYLLAQSTQYQGSWQQKLRQFIEVLLSPKVIMRLLLAIMVIALVLTRSRMGNTAFFASLMISGALALVLMKNKSRSTIILLSSLLVIDIAIVGTFFGVEKVADRLQNSSTSKESRDEVSRDTLMMWQEHPILGIGAGTYQYTYPTYKSNDVVATRLYDHAHNDYLQFLAEFGVVGFALLLSAVLWSLWWAIQAMRQRRSDLFKGLGFASCMGLIAIGIHSSVDFNLQIPANAFMFVFMMALAAIARWMPRTSRPAPSRRSRQL